MSTADRFLAISEPVLGPSSPPLPLHPGLFTLCLSLSLWPRCRASDKTAPVTANGLSTTGPLCSRAFLPRHLCVSHLFSGINRPPLPYGPLPNPGVVAGRDVGTTAQFPLGPPDSPFSRSHKLWTVFRKPNSPSTLTSVVHLSFAFYQGTKWSFAS